MPVEVKPMCDILRIWSLKGNLENEKSEKFMTNDWTILIQIEIFNIVCTWDF